MSTLWALVASVALLALNGFFVAAEFALVAAKQHKLDAMAEVGGVFARVARRAKGELPLMLAGAQLGITLCSLGLGALAEPAIAHLIDPLLVGVGLPETAAYVIAFVVSLTIVVFLHMVVGEMAPKSWAITHPEKSATMLAWPFVGFTTAVRVVLTALNGLANAALRLVGVRTVGALPPAHGPDELEILLRQSHEHGLLETGHHDMLTGALQIHEALIGDVARAADDIVTVPVGASVARIEALSGQSGRSRLIVTDSSGVFVGVVHVRDVLKASIHRPDASAGDLMTPPLRLDSAVEIADAITLMRLQRAQIALVTTGSKDIGLVAMEDLLEEVIGQFDDETDTTTVRRP